MEKAGKPIGKKVIRVHAPAAEADEEKHEFYGGLQETIDGVSKGYIKIVISDFNAKVGEGGRTRAALLNRHTP